MEEKPFKEPKEVKKETKKCLCSERIGRNIRCPDHGDVDKIWHNFNIVRQSLLTNDFLEYHGY